MTIFPRGKTAQDRLRPQERTNSKQKKDPKQRKKKECAARGSAKVWPQFSLGLVQTN
jgi:hypothetical protein